ncbi:MAG TPA: hypothetical protein VLE95_03280 [Chlamydiales bacterium]|nr:hypothetical protein [Chlamydiales bacterium]
MTNIFILDNQTQSYVLNNIKDLDSQIKDTTNKISNFKPLNTIDKTLKQISELTKLTKDDEITISAVRSDLRNTFAKYSIDDIGALEEIFNPAIKKIEDIHMQNEHRINSILVNTLNCAGINF